MGSNSTVLSEFAPTRFAVAVVSPPNQHDISGEAFNDVAEALHHGLVALGHDSVLTKRFDLDERRTIVLGGNLLVQYGLKPPKNPIFYNLEQLGDDLPWMTMPEFVDLFRRYPHWDYSHANVELLTALGLPRPIYVPIGYVPELTRIAPAPEDIDVLFYGALNGRRYAVLKELHDRGLRVKWLSSVYGSSRDAWIARSKIVLNMHYWDAKIFEITRVSYLLANKRAVVSERGADPALERDLQTGIAFAEYDELVDRCVELVSDDRVRYELAERGYAAFTARDQAAILQRALSEELEDPYMDVRLDRTDRSADRKFLDRQQFTQSLFKHKSAKERDWLLARVEDNPEDGGVVFFLAETLFLLGDFAAARDWCVRRIEMGGCGEEVYWAMYLLAESMSNLGEPWPDVEDAYLKAWEFRPTRAEALHAIAFRYRVERRYTFAYLFAQRANEIPFPDADLFVPRYADIYAWRATDELAVCASQIGRHNEAFTLCRRLLARPDLPDCDRQRIAANRDLSVSVMLEAAKPYPATLAQSPAAVPGQVEVTVSLIAGPDRETTEQTINSFLTCCLDVSRVGRFLVLDTGLSAPDRATLRKRYGFLQFARRRSSDKPTSQLAQLRAQIDSRFWLHLGAGWRFFAPENYITRLSAVLNAEPQVLQVGINVDDAITLTGVSAAEKAVRRAPDAGRYLLTETMATGPAMFDTTRLDRARSIRTSDRDLPARRSRPATHAETHTASLDEVLCITTAYQNQGTPGRDELPRRGDSSDLASLETQSATSPFREFHQQNTAERMRLVMHQPEQERHRLLAEVQRNPEDAQSVLFLAETYFQIGDFAKARNWCTRRIEMGGNDEEIYWALVRLAASMAELGEPWPYVEDAYLRAWIFRPTRAEGLHALAVRYRLDQRYRLGYLVAHQAAQIPFPGEDLFVPGYFAEIYAWRALSEQAMCAHGAGKQAEAFALCRHLVARSDIPDRDRQRIATTRDFSVPAMLEAAAPYPEALVQSLIAEPGDTQITVTLVAGPDPQTLVRTLNSFLTCCLDVSRVGRFLVLDTGLSAPDRNAMQQRYGFLEFIRRRFTSKRPELVQLHSKVDTRYWLHLGQGWQFFAPENLISRLAAILQAQPQVFQVGINFADATILTGTTAVEDVAHRTPDAGLYVFTETTATGPAMFDTTRFNPATGPHVATSLTASLDEVFCIQPLSTPGQPNQLIPAQTQLTPAVVRPAYLKRAVQRLNHGLSGMPLSVTPIIDVKPVVRMPNHDAQMWSTTGVDPSFQLHLPPGFTRIQTGWYLLSMELMPTAGRLHHPKLYRDHGDGFREQDSDPLVLADNTTHHRLLIKVERPIYALRLDPTGDTSDVSEFLLGSLRIHRISPLEAMLRLAVRETRRMQNQDETWLHILRGICVALHRGPTVALKNLHRDTHEGTDYSEWIKTHDSLDKASRAQIRADIDKMEERPLISIVLPVHNTPERWLRACLDSVRSQLYDVWELCVADDASTEPHVRIVLQEYAARDSRIKVVFRQRNGHISAASNSAIELASGDYLALLDHDDVLPPHALFHVAQTIIRHPEARLIYSDEDKIDENGKRYDPYFKSDWNPVLFCAHNMFSHFGVYSRDLVRDVGGFREGWEGSQDYDLAFRCIERVEREQIFHIPHVLYHWRAVTGSTALGPGEKNYAHIAAEKSINAHFERQGVEAYVTPVTGLVGTFRLSYQLRDPEPSVSIIIPTRNGGQTLRRCLDSIRERTDYSNYEIVIVNNQSDEQETIDLLEREGRRQHQRVVFFDEPFNFSRLNNIAARQSDREVLVFLNDDTEIITAEWLRELVSLAIQPGVGAVGAMLYYPDDQIQHAGVILGLGADRVAGHAYHRKARGYPGDKCRALLVQEMSAVTAACMAIKRDRFEDVRGFDESLAVAYNDVDLCLRLSRNGYHHIWTPNAELYHYESLTRGSDTTLSKRRRLEGDCDAMRERWGDVLLHDPYYHPALSLDQGDFITYSRPRTKEGAPEASRS